MQTKFFNSTQNDMKKPNRLIQKTGCYKNKKAIPVSRNGFSKSITKNLI